MNTEPKEHPEPPKGYRLLTAEEKSKPLPMDALYWDTTTLTWDSSAYRGDVTTDYDQRHTNYATRVTPPTRDTDLRAALAECVAALEGLSKAINSVQCWAETYVGEQLDIADAALTRATAILKGDKSHE